MATAAGRRPHAPAAQRADPVDTAWRIHGALLDWTGKVDAKAGFSLSVETALLAATVALSGGGSRFSARAGAWPTALLWAGVGLLCAAVLLCVGVVLPRMSGARTPGDWPENFIYFGHLQHWNPERLALALRATDPLPALGRELVEMSRVAWRKHRLVQWSLLTATAGTAAVAAAWLAAGTGPPGLPG